ncbi:hypothetical protein C8Q73DRAFT_687577 [Cubamyces lactineus]|nr:hypothetical protein C8Q73DRAFT_687577 [Cubamyces lactineus]
MFAARAWVSFFALGLCRVALVSAQTAPPPIVKPRSGDVWTVGELQTVQWSTTGIQVFGPDGKTPLTGHLWLGHLTNTSDPDSSGYWLWVNEPLSVNFPLSAGQVDVMVPEVPTGSVYFVGIDKSDNLSQLFTIKNPKDPNGTGVEPSDITVTTVPFSTASASSNSTSTQTATSALTSGTSPASSNGTSSGSATSGGSSNTSSGTSKTATVLSGTSSTGTATSSSSSSSASSTPNGAVGMTGAGAGLTLVSLAMGVFFLC